MVGVRTAAREVRMTNDKRQMSKEIRMMNLERAKQGHQQGAADVSSAELLSLSSAGKMPAAPWGSWSHFRHFRMHWDHEPTPNPSQEGNWHDADECLLPSWEGLEVGLLPTGL